MIIHPVVTCHSVPSLGPLIGNKGGARLTEELNHLLSINGGGTVFAQNSSSSIQERMTHFLETVIEPEMRDTEHFMTVIGNSFIDAIRDIVSVEDLENGIPVSMHEAILTHAPIRSLLEAGEIYGFGYKPEELPSEDRIGRMISNGTVMLLGDMPEDGWEINWEWRSDDPDLTFEELDSIERTRSWFDEFIAQTSFDPTSYPDKRGALRE